MPVLTHPDDIAAPRTAPVYGVRAIDQQLDGYRVAPTERTEEGGDLDVALISIRVLGNGTVGLVISGKGRPPILLVMSPGRARQLASGMLTLAGVEQLPDCASRASGDSRLDTW